MSDDIAAGTKTTPDLCGATAASTKLVLLRRPLLADLLEQVRADWERDLRPLLPQFIAYEVARESVLSVFERE
jgi:hypothetical protein